MKLVAPCPALPAASDASALNVLSPSGNADAGPTTFVQELVAATRSRAQDVQALPESVEGVVTTRIDGLAPADRALLRWASVLGASFSGDLVAQVLEGDHLVTCLVGIHDARSGTVTFASAGHPPPLHLGRDGDVGYVDVSPGLPPVPAQKLPWLIAILPESDKVKPLLKASQKAQAEQATQVAQAPEDYNPNQPGPTMQR